MKPGALGASSYLILNAGACRVCRVGADSVTCDRFQCKAQTQPPLYFGDMETHRIPLHVTAVKLKRRFVDSNLRND